MKESFFKRLIKKYNAGAASDAERFIVDTWYNSFDEDKPAVPGTRSEQELEMTRSRIFSKINPQKAPKKLWYRKAWLQTAALLTIVSGLYIGYKALDNPDVASKPSPVMDQVYSAGQKEIKKILLKDSTVIWLNANSSIRLPGDFGKKDRRLNLIGEANFEVRRDTLRPFIVDAGEISVRVLGTAFNVQAYHKLDEIKVSVSRGKVQVNEGQRELALLTKEKGLVYHKNTNEFEAGDVVAAKNSAWIDGKIVLEKASYRELKQAMLNLYGLNLNTSSKKVMSFKYNITLHGNQSEKDAIEMLMTILNKKIKREGPNEITIY